MRWLVALAVATMALVFSATALAAHSWSDHHWLVKSGPRELTVKESVGDAYSPDAVWADWAGQSGQFLTLAHTSGRKANITVEEGSFGNTGWIGLAQVWKKNGHISRSAIKLNTFYDAANPWLTDPDKKQSVYCMEFGHVLGLAHTGGDTCMNDEAWYASSNAHDGWQIGLIYGHSHADGGGKQKPPRGKKNRSGERGPFTVHISPAPGFSSFLSR